MTVQESEVKKIDRRVTNPWKWQDALGFVQAVEVRNGQRVLYCAGQLSVDANGMPVNVGDIRAQIEKALDNLETLLKEAGYSIQDIVRVNLYTTDVDECLKNFDVFAARLGQAGGRYSCTLLGVTRLAWVESMVEIEVTAVT